METVIHYHSEFGVIIEHQVSILEWFLKDHGIKLSIILHYNFIAASRPRRGRSLLVGPLQACCIFMEESGWRLMKLFRMDPTGCAFHRRLALISVKIKDNEAFKPSEPLSACGHTERFDMERQGEKRSGKGGREESVIVGSEQLISLKACNCKLWRRWVSSCESLKTVGTVYVSWFVCGQVCDLFYFFKPLLTSSKMVKSCFAPNIIRCLWGHGVGYFSVKLCSQSILVFFTQIMGWAFRVILFWVVFVLPSF